MAERRNAWRCNVPDGLEMATVSINGRQFEGELADQSAVGCRLILPAEVEVSEGDMLLLYIHSEWHEGIVKRHDKQPNAVELGIEWGRDLYYDSSKASIFQLIGIRFAQLFGTENPSPSSIRTMAICALVPFLIAGYFVFGRGSQAVAPVEHIDINEVSEASFDLEQRVAKTEVEKRVRDTLDNVRILLNKKSRKELQLDDSQTEEIEEILLASRAKLSAYYKILRPDTLSDWSEATLRQRNRLRTKVQEILTPDQVEGWRKLSRGESLSAS